MSNPIHPQNEHLDNHDALLKAKAAAGIVNDVLKRLLSQVKPGASVAELSKLGDDLIQEACSKTFKKVSSKGVAFPSCINVNEIVCHHSPIDSNTGVLKENDVVRLDLGAHIDGYIAVAAQTVFLTNNRLEGRVADLMAAAEQSLAACLRLMKPGHKNIELASVVQRIADTYGVSICDGVLGHEMKRFVIDGSNCILLKPTADHTVPEFHFEEGRSYSLDIVLSLKDGKLIEHSSKPTIYKYTPEHNYVLKSKTAKETLQSIKALELPFSIRDLPDPNRARVGLLELYQSSLVDRYPVLACRKDDLVVHLKTTVHVLGSGVQSMTGIPDVQPYSSNIQIQDESILKLLRTGLKTKSRKKRKAKKQGDSMDDAED